MQGIRVRDKQTDKRNRVPHELQVGREEVSSLPDQIVLSLFLLVLP